MRSHPDAPRSLVGVIDGRRLRQCFRVQDRLIAPLRQRLYHPRRIVFRELFPGDLRSRILAAR
jgi:hypothetical protein